MSEQEEFYFNAKENCIQFIEVIRHIYDIKCAKVPKDEQQEIFEYYRRGHLFIIEQSTNSKRQGRQTKDLRNQFILTGISQSNKIDI